jgi:hypothetical protein
MIDEEKLKASDSFLCPSCSGNMSFDPATQTLKCNFCGYKAEIQKVSQEINEYDLSSFNEQSLPPLNEMKYTIKCEHCGGITHLEQFQTASKCVFCGSNQVISIKDTPGIKPESLIPFKRSKEETIELINKYLKSKWMAPRNLSKSFITDSLQGIYVPFWHYDADTFSPYTALRGDYYYVTRTVGTGKNKRTVTERHTRWTPVAGNYSNFFNDVEVSASGTKNASTFERVFPFNYKGLVVYDKQYLAGFVAEHYAVTLKQGWSTAQRKMQQAISFAIRRQIGGDTISNLSYKTQYSNTKFKHLLLPFWLCVYQYNNKKYSLTINGQTGKISGTSPVSPYKVLVIILSVILLITIFAIVILSQQ